MAALAGPAGHDRADRASRCRAVSRAITRGARGAQSVLHGQAAMPPCGGESMKSSAFRLQTTLARSFLVLPALALSAMACSSADADDADGGPGGGGAVSGSGSPSGVVGSGG